MTSKLPNQPDRATATAADRWTALDALRGLAVILMVQQHLGVWLAFALGTQSPLWPLFRVLNMAGGAAAPLFILLAGVGVALAERRDHLRPSTWALRGVVLFGFGVLLNLLVPHWFSPGSFYVLHLLGIWLVLAPWIAKAKNPSLLGMAIAIIGLGGILQVALSTPPVLGNEALADASKPGGVLRLALVEGHFPLFPWLAPAVVGLWAGRQLVAGTVGRVVSLALACGVGSGLLLSAGLIDRAVAIRSPFRQFVRFSFYPASASFLLALMAIALIAVVAFAIFDRTAARELSKPAAGSQASASSKFAPGSFFPVLGRTSLTLLFVHIVLFREVFGRLGLRNQLSVSATLATIAAFIVGWAWLSRIWWRAEFVLSLEWWLRRVPQAVLSAGGTQERPR